ncbi:MAG: pyruvate dehydrogenase (acetyl-transferring) E1 component subunit alpha [Candidatus Cloacimonadaceae bacterium]|jgi:pyruvate dehydrogenase E1 component alpha subunit|nr:pyruvate dehydrogenase (acetyl-transferring) E1 component subunit alpha [Candidatus Cloacimonadota bacterium]MDY0126658.1 pyruvate dehydrogenase (acetyl-transferring) E1 component subunit alpha [Candidatus Cloacimonadaceae bacterium]MCB5255552.1 pyruvate dehydrogenase (acetyl-transferring) E1 component subunit alpha [Candidatus Cloacimonadota bacterium]MCK9177380.1 pyruvate dehydrogenase (acetyl-transferring) E1 component subunit alpha [Candidatus Cloacimonadota bacterium]MCK9241819.1 pyruva
MIDQKTLNKYDPIKNKAYQLIDDEGKPLDKVWKPRLSDEEILQAYKDLLFARTADLMAVSYQRQGRMYTYPPNLGQEAIHIAAGIVTKEQDWLVPAFRELGAWLAKGVSLKEVFLYFKGTEDGSRFEKANRVLPIAVPIASQLPHAVGLGYAINYNKEKDAAVFAYVGDGGTSEGDFHEALNFAAVWNAPVIFVIQNNQFAISVPLKMQTKSINLAIKGMAYNVPSLLVDGNDFFAMHEALSYAREQAVQGKGPFLIEARTYRTGAHTTSDDPSKYRTKEEEELWADKDPLKRLKGYILHSKIDELKEEEKLIKQYKTHIDSEFEAAEKHPEYKIEDVFGYMFEELPDELKRQKNAYENYLRGVK